MFTIITPTIGRDTLLRTCESVNKQTCEEWEHLVVFDGPETNLEIFSKIEHPQRRIIFSGTKFGNYGHPLKFFAYDLASNDYLMYIDDDDWYNRICLELIKKSIDPDCPFIFFYALWRGNMLLHIPPKRKATLSCQYCHRKLDGQGNQIRFPPWLSGGGYAQDGQWIESMAKAYSYIVIEDEIPLVFVDQVNRGQ